jgi:predicted pyridoxine 5'-phosphate oxidase superfamily flavin-nucleotide-binding protein
MTTNAGRLPGSEGEHRAQEMFGTTKRALAFYDHQMLDRLTPLMCDFIRGQEMVFIATADGHGHTDSSVRFGPPGFVHVLDERTLIYPEYRGNGVMASVGNMLENPNIGLLFLDFQRETVGLHANGKARIVEIVDGVARITLAGAVDGAVDGVPVPAFSSALAYFDSYRTARLPANLLQSQRDYFGSHTYERIDTPRGEFFHLDWLDPKRQQIKP